MRDAAGEMAEAMLDYSSGLAFAGDTLDLDQVQAKAAGGPVFSPTLALLSEYGQEEYVVPQASIPNLPFLSD